MSRKDTSPQETICQIERILHENGLAYKITSELNNCDFFYSVRVEIYDRGSIIGSNGKGMTRELALASGLAELMERLQSRNGMKFWYSTKDYPEKAFAHEYQSDEELVDPIKNDFAEYRDSKMIHYRIDYTDAKSNENISVPNRLLNLLCGSNGLCAGNSKTEALVQGTSEIFERYVRKLISKEHIRCPYIQKEEMRQYAFFDKMQCFEERGFVWELLDCSCNDQYPVAGLLLLDKKRLRYAIVLGADVDFEIAVERCITELLQGRKLEQLSKYMKLIDFEGIGDKTIDWSVEAQSDYYEFIDNYIANCGKNPIYLLMETEQVKVPSIFGHFENNNDAYQYMLSIVEKNQLSLYYADFSYLGFPTYRVYLPQLSQVFEMEKESFVFIDNMKENLNLMMKISNLAESKKRQLVTNLVDLSRTYTYRRNTFYSILFRFCGEKDFDFNYLYLDFVIALLYLSLCEYKKAEMHYTRFITEHRIFKNQAANELLKVIYTYVKGLALGQQLDEIKKKGNLLFNQHTNQYVYEFIKYDKCLKIVYWPSCPDCANCSYKKECAYEEWQRINQVLREKQRMYYKRRKA